MFICRSLVDGVPVRGSINRKTGRPNIYVITGWPLPKCPCVSWAISRNRSVSLRDDVQKRYPDAIAWCKHLESHWDRMCHYASIKDGDPIITNMCPMCSGPLVEVTLPGQCIDCGVDLPDKNLKAGLCDDCIFARL